MKKLVLYFLLLFPVSIVNADINLAYLDIQYIIDNSNLGQIYKKNLKEKSDKFKSKLSIKEDEIKKQEAEINNQKNILKENELKIKINKLNKQLKEYQTSKKELNQNFILEKRELSSKILKLLNPILTKYVDENNIKIVIEKKNILVGIKTLDITDNILKIFNEETKNLTN
mgnify:FL=1|tara:strand:+ start:830 stop:1342 length:513 start_codon:yes stop_codon:yes gene_type:complete